MRYVAGVEAGMAFETKRPQDIVRRVATRRAARSEPVSGAWRRESFTLPRAEARSKARELFDRFPKAAYATEIEFWRELDDGRIEFTMRRLPTAD